MLRKTVLISSIAFGALCLATGYYLLTPGTRIDNDISSGASTTVPIRKDRVIFLNSADTASNDDTVDVLLIVNTKDSYPEYYNDSENEYGISLRDLFSKGDALQKQIDQNREELNEEQLSLLLNEHEEILRKSSELLGIINDKIKIDELKWLTGIGATSIVERGYFMFEFSLDESKLNDLNSGECNYIAVINGKKKHNENIDIEEYLGSYVLTGQCYQALYSSAAHDDTDISRIIMRGDKILFTNNLDTLVFESDYHTLDCSINDVITSFPLDGFRYMSEDLQRDSARSETILALDSGGKRIILSGNKLYYDAGINGIFLFEKQD